MQTIYTDLYKSDYYLTQQFRFETESLLLFWIIIR